MTPEVAAMPGAPAEEADVQHASPRGGRYAPGEELGRGGWGFVSRAHDRQLERDVAIKRVHGELAGNEAIRDRFVGEARVTAQLQHPGVAPVHELGVASDGAPYYVMKLLEGPTLKQALRDEHQYQAPRGAGVSVELLERFIDVCNTIACAHQQRIIHRDLKPDNILVGRFGETVVVDWGLAKRLDAGPEPAAESIEVTLAPDPGATAAPPGTRRPGATTRRNATSASATRHGSVLGTPAYMSPEQSRGEIEALTEATDIYALGVILYEMLTGENPFRADDVETTLTRVREGDYRPPRAVNRGVPRALAAICTTAMAHDPADRYPTAEAIVADVRRYLAGERVSVGPDPLWAKIDRWRRRRPALTAGVLGSLCALTVASLAFGVVIARAHDAERTARLAAETARREALERLADARRAGDAWLIDLSGALEFFPGMDALRDGLLKQAIDHYTELAATLSDANDAARRLEAARCQIRLGDLHRLLAQTDRAREAYRLGAHLLETGDLSDRSRLELVNAHIGLALLGDSLDLRPAAEWLQAQTDDDARGASVRLAIARARGETLDGRTTLQTLRDAEATAADLADRLNQPRDHQRLQTVRDELTRRLRDTGRLREAAQIWLAELARLDRRIDEQPGRPDLIQARAFARMRLAGLDVRRQRNADTTAGYEDAIADLRHAWRLSDADAYYHRNVAISLANLGRSAGAPEAAGRHLSEAIEQLRLAVAVDGPSASDLERLAECEVGLGGLAARRRDPAAMAHYAAAEQCYAVLEDHGELTGSRRVKRARLFANRATMHLDAGDAISAMLDLEQADKSLANAEDSGLLAARVAVLRAESLRRRGDDEAAAEVARAGRRELRRLADEEASSEGEDYPIAMLALVDHLIESPEAAADDLAEAADWLTTMRRRNPDCARNADWLQRSALLHARLGKPQLAKRAAQQTLAARADDPLAALILAWAEDGPEIGSEAAADRLEKTPGDRRLRLWVGLLANPQS